MLKQAKLLNCAGVKTLFAKFKGKHNKTCCSKLEENNDTFTFLNYLIKVKWSY